METTSSLSTAVPLKPSPKKGRRNISKTEKITTPDEAAQILQSALKYCRKANLSVNGFNDGVTLRISIAGLNFLDGKIVIAESKSDTKLDGVTP